MRIRWHLYVTKQDLAAVSIISSVRLCIGRIGMWGGGTGYIDMTSCTSLSIDPSWSFVSSLLWSIVSLIDTYLYQWRKLNPYNNTTYNIPLLKNISRFTTWDLQRDPKVRINTNRKEKKDSCKWIIKKRQGGEFLQKIKTV